MMVVLGKKFVRPLPLGNIVDGLKRLWCLEGKKSFILAEESKQFWENLWNSVLQRIQRPVAGVLLSPDQARELGEPLLLRLVHGGDEAEVVKLTSDGLEEAVSISKRYVAQERKDCRDQERHRDPEDDRYERNLNLPNLQKKKGDGSFDDEEEWTLLHRFLRPFGIRVLRKKGLQSEDEEEVFNETVASLALEGGKNKKAPIDGLVVFEEVIPNFCRRAGFRAIDLIRQKTAQKARPDSLLSLDQMVTEEGRSVEIADPRQEDQDRPESWNFEEIYSRCRELLNAQEWRLVFDLYVAQVYTVKDLVADAGKLAALGIDSGASASTLRRRVEEIVNPALEKLAEELSL